MTTHHLTIESTLTGEAPYFITLDPLTRGITKRYATREAFEQELMACGFQPNTIATVLKELVGQGIIREAYCKLSPEAVYLLSLAEGA